MDAEKFGAFIAEARKAQGMTQLELAGEIGVTDKAVSRWERGRGFPDISLLEPLAKALDVSLLELMHAQRFEQKHETLTEQDAAELMNCAAQITREMQLQEKTAGWLSVVITLSVGALTMLTGHANFGGGLFVGALAAELVVSLYYYIKNRENKSSRRIYGTFVLMGISIIQFLANIMKIDPDITIDVLELVLIIIIGAFSI